MFRIIKRGAYLHWKRGKSAVDRKTGNGRKSAQITVNIIGAARQVTPEALSLDAVSRALDALWEHHKPASRLASVSAQPTRTGGACSRGPSSRSWGECVLHPDSGGVLGSRPRDPSRQALERGWNLQEGEGQDQSRPQLDGPRGGVEG